MFDPKRLKSDDNGHMWAQMEDGRKVRVLCTDGPGEWPVIGIIEGHRWTDVWALDGRISPPNGSRADLMNLPEPPREIEAWAVVDENGVYLATYRNLWEAQQDCAEGETIVHLTGTWEPSD